MSTVNRRSVFAVVSLVALTGSLLPVTAQATPADPGEDKVVMHQFEGQQEAPSYWTKERMQKAQDLTKKKSGKVVSKKQQEKLPPEVIPGKQPLKAAAKSTSPLTRASAKAVREKPQPTIGKVFFTVNGKDYVCSANSVNSQNGSTVSTAAHCVNERGRYASRFIFVPAYENGDAPYGKWTAVNAFAPSDWIRSEDMEVDTAFVVVGKNKGQTLSDTVGATGVAFNQQRGLKYKAFGYPAGEPYDGETLWSCTGTAVPDKLEPESQAQGIPCDMTGGSSGGPWFMGGKYTGTSSVQNSVNSYGRDEIPDYMFGPYWGSVVQKTYNKASSASGR
ncbi:trypsin-like serine peptidase [Dermatophilus congolensis]|uniref:trypsin-like serine peptidase n=1 Tax=Dermatophilus congolensis TaxID=1863 RepID=UPI001AAE2FE3|nr:hypothetical protein [Dermatophilus congolensis]MBO3143539.1 hypothetical protein [Dermatophilus congolensis]MBO3152530.1 hypothetical protein [Dermatophilus congolensis]MBO3160459.1 hypothetical protein [Dermatophilus congolensis]MBO3163816.1 hypothetical protein [Dermatophilus congolensis]MBO3177362.1 hypothetical protein [Dermatophilus congolensis]